MGQGSKVDEPLQLEHRALDGGPVYRLRVAHVDPSCEDTLVQSSSGSDSAGVSRRLA